MGYRVSVRLTEQLARGIDARVQRTGKTKSEVIREALTAAGLRAPSRRAPAEIADLLGRAAELRAAQSEPTDVVALLHDVRGQSLRLRLRQLTVPFMRADLT